VKLRDGETINYDSCFVATGGVARTLPIAGMDSTNIFVLREFDDAKKIADAVEGKHVVIVGSSFIGMETASCIVKKTKTIIVLGMEKVPFERVLGTDVGFAMQKFHEKNGVQFRMESVVQEFKTANKQITHVVLKNGEILPCDVVVLGAGIIPATGFIKPSEKVKLNPRDKSVICDQFMKVCDGLYAGGDIATFPYFGLDNKQIRIEHWGIAQYQGMISAMNMMGKNTPFRSIPFFWTTVFGKTIRYCGYALEYDEVIIDKPDNGFEPDVLNFVAYYSKSNKIYAACSTNVRDPMISRVSELMNSDRMPSAIDIKKSIKETGSSDNVIRKNL